MSPALPYPRFPGFDVMAQADHWDPVTRDLVENRLDPGTGASFFSLTERRAAGALVNRLTGQDDEQLVPVLQMLETRLAAGTTDGWHYQKLPHDADAWRQSLLHLDADAHARHGTDFADCSLEEQNQLLEDLQGLGDDEWHGLWMRGIWSLWMRYVCAEFYAHPLAWQEIGFPGPAFPRGYKNLGLDRREGAEVPQAHPEQGSEPRP